MSLIEIKNLYHNYGTFHLDNINISIAEKQIAYLIGNSGSGKSTLLKLIAGLENAKSGEISVNGQVVFSNRNLVKPEDRGVGIIFQYPSLFPHKTVIENVIFAIRGMDKNAKYNFAMEKLRDVGMDSYADYAPYAISGGQQQLVTIARTLAQRPKVVLLDEPFSNLDSALRRKIREQMLSILLDHDVAAIVVTHDPEEALEMANNIYVMRDGSIIQHGSPHDIYYRPVDLRFAKFFGLINPIPGKYKDNTLHTAWGKISLSSPKKLPYARPEAILLCNAEEGLPSVVKNVRFFNRIVDIEIQGAIYHVRFTIALLPKKGDIIYVKLDTKQLLFLTN